MAEAKSATSLVRDAWETVAHLGTLKGLLFLLSLAAFLDVAGVRLGFGNLVALQWKAPIPGPGTMLLALSVFIALPLLVAPLVQRLLEYLIGFCRDFGLRVAKQRSESSCWPSRLAS